MKLNQKQMRAIVRSTEAGQYVSEYLAEKVRMLYVDQPPPAVDGLTDEEKKTYNNVILAWRKKMQLEPFLKNHMPLIEDTRSIEKTIFSQALASVKHWPDSVAKIETPKELWSILVLAQSPSGKSFVDMVIDNIVQKKLNPPQLFKMPDEASPQEPAPEA